MKKIIIASVALLTVFSCTKENIKIADVDSESAVSGFVPMTFIVSSEPVKTTMDENRVVSFRENESIAVWSVDEADGATAPHKYTTSTGGVNAEFTGDAPSGATRYYAAFPYSDGLRCNAGVISGLSVGSGTDGTGTGKFNSSKAVAVATTTGSNLYFRQVCALLKVTVPAGVDLKEVVVFNRDNDSGNTAGAITGTFNVTVADDGSFDVAVTTPKFQIGFVGPSGSGTAAPAGDYYLPVLPAQLTDKKGIDLRITWQDGLETRAFNGSALKLNSAKVYNLGTLAKTVEYIDNGFETGNISNFKGNTGALSVVENPYKTSANSSDHVLKNIVSGDSSTSGYIEIASGSDYGYRKFPSSVRGYYDRLRIKVWLGNNLYYPRIKRGNNAPALPFKINGVELNGDIDTWNANVKTDDWNVLEYRASDIDGGWSSFSNLATYQIRPLVDSAGNNVSGYDADTNNRCVYIDDITFILK